MKLRNRLIIFSTFLVSTVAAALVSVALGTEWWFSWRAEKCVDNSLASDSDPSYVRSGLFYGFRYLNKGCLGLRESRIVVNEDIRIGQSFHATGLWISTILFAALTILWAVVGAIFSLINTVVKPYETIVGPLGLYLWNSLGLLSSFLCIVVYVIDYYLNIRSGVVAYEEQSKQWQDISVRLEYSFYLIVAALGCFMANLIFLLINGIEPKPRFPRADFIDHPGKDAMIF